MYVIVPMHLLPSTCNIYYRFEDLVREERIVQQEISALDKKFDSWAQLGAAKSVDRKKPAPMLSSRDVTKDLPPEVAAFEVRSKYLSIVCKCNSLNTVQQTKNNYDYRYLDMHISF